MRDFDKLEIKISASFHLQEKYEVAKHYYPKSSYEKRFRFSFSLYPDGEIMDEIHKHVLLQESQLCRIIGQMNKIKTRIVPHLSTYLLSEDRREITIEKGASKFHYEWYGQTPAELSPFEELIDIVRKIA